MKRSQVAGLKYFRKSSELNGHVLCFDVVTDHKCLNCGAVTELMGREVEVHIPNTSREKVFARLKGYGLSPRENINRAVYYMDTPSKQACRACAHTAYCKLEP